MKWSLLVGRFWGTEIRLHASLLLLVPYALVVFKPEDLPGAVRVLVILSAIFACVALHEMGHTLAARLYGIQVTSIVLWPLGGFANLSRRPEQALPDLVISAAGPLTNLVIFALLGVITAAEQILERSMMFPELTRFLWRADVYPFLLSLTLANLSLAVFNLVPIFPLDGGQIARSLLKLLFGEKNADRILLVISLPLALALTAAGFFARDAVLVLTGLILVLATATLNLRVVNGLTLLWQYFLDRGGYYHRQQDFDPAIEAYTRSIERTPNRPGPFIGRAVIHMSLLDLAAAQADLEQALRLDPKNAVAWALRGELYSLAEDRESALVAHNRAVELRPTWSTAYLDRGGVYHELGDLARAQADLDKAVEIGKGSPVAYLMRSLLRYEMGDLNGAHADADQVLRYAPRWMLIFPEIFLIGLKGHLNWALDYYWRAIEQFPNAYQVYQGRGDICRANGRPAWAIEDYHRAIRLAPAESELYLARGRAYLAMGMTSQADQDLRQAIQLAKKSHIKRQATALLQQISGSAVTPADSATASLSTPGSAVSAAPHEPAARPAESASTPPASGSPNLE